MCAQYAGERAASYRQHQVAVEREDVAKEGRLHDLDVLELGVVVDKVAPDRNPRHQLGHVERLLGLGRKHALRVHRVVPVLPVVLVPIVVFVIIVLLVVVPPRHARADRDVDEEKRREKDAHRAGGECGASGRGRATHF